MVPSKIVVELFYDIVSPYSWIAFEILCRYRSKWDIDLQWRPFFLSAIMKETGNSPALISNKIAYMQNDLKRLSEYTKVPVSIPEHFPDIMFGGLPAQRFITAVDIKQPQFTEELSRQFWIWNFQIHKEVLQVDRMKQIAKQIGMQDPDIKDAAARINEKETKDRLKSYTDKALNYGAFGSPIIVAHINSKPELFFGSDRFELLAHIMGKKWLGPNLNSNL